jgi:hypothetical protein
MEQWCLPSRRQQAGRSEPEEVMSGSAISGKLKRASNKAATARRIGISIRRDEFELTNVDIMQTF